MWVIWAYALLVSYNRWDLTRFFISKRLKRRVGSVYTCRCEQLWFLCVFFSSHSFPLFCLLVEPNLKLKMRVQLVNAAGLDEAGIDGGGVFREFLSELLKAGFDPNRGFFKYTADRLLYPNPQASILAANFKEHSFFLGRMLGKVGLTFEDGKQLPKLGWMVGALFLSFLECRHQLHMQETVSCSLISTERIGGVWGGSN